MGVLEKVKARLWADATLAQRQSRATASGVRTAVSGARGGEKMLTIRTSHTKIEASRVVAPDASAPVRQGRVPLDP
jgi:hypothetical protein